MTYNEKDFLEYFTSNEFICYQAYDGFVSDKFLKEKSPIETYINKSYTTELCIERIKKIFERQAGKYTFVCFPHYNSKFRTRVQVDTITPLTVHDSSYEQLEEPQLNSTEQVKNLEEIIERRLQARLIEQQERDKAEADRKELEELRTQGGKFAYAMNLLIAQFMPALMPSKPMNGTEQPTQPKATATELEKAFTVILKKLGADTIIKLASKIEKGEAEHVLPLLNNFVNS